MNLILATHVVHSKHPELLKALVAVDTALIALLLIWVIALLWERG